MDLEGTRAQVVEKGKHQAEENFALYTVNVLIRRRTQASGADAAARSFALAVLLLMLGSPSPEPWETRMISTASD